MDGGAWWAIVHGAAESDPAERLTHTHTHTHTPSRWIFWGEPASWLSSAALQFKNRSVFLVIQVQGLKTLEPVFTMPSCGQMGKNWVILVDGIKRFGDHPDLEERP